MTTELGGLTYNHHPAISFNAVARSIDGGHHWTAQRLDSNAEYRAAPLANNDTHADGNVNQAPNWGSEVYFSQTKNGRVLALVRTEDSPTSWLARSKDESGASWEPLSRAPFFACAAAMITTTRGPGAGVTLVGGRGDGTTVAATWDSGFTWRLFTLEVGIFGGNGVMYEAEPSVIIFISGGWGLAPPHYWRLRVTQDDIELLPVSTTLVAKTDDSMLSRGTKCSCANALLCLPLAHGPPPNADIHVWSDCGGPWQNFCNYTSNPQHNLISRDICKRSLVITDEPGNCKKHPGDGCNSTCNWRDLDFNTITTLGRDVGHSLGVQEDGGVTINPSTADWPDSELVCHAHANDVRVVAAVHPYIDHVYPKSKRPHDPCFYQRLLANATAHKRLAAELVEAIRDAGMDGIDFDFEGIDRAVVANCSAGFDYGTAHVAMIKTVTGEFHSSFPHSTVTVTMGGSNISDAVHAEYLSVYPIPGLSDASDGIFIMAYDMNHHHVLCADANSPLDVLHSNVLSYIDLGARPEKLILGVPWYGYMKRCNDSYTSPSPFPQCADATCLVGDADHYDENDYSMGVWAVEELLANKSSGCIRSWSEQHGSPYMDCPASSLGPYPPFRLAPPPGEPLRTQTWYDDANSTRLKAEMAKSLRLGGVGAFTGENVGPPGNGWSERFWDALKAVKTDDIDTTAACEILVAPDGSDSSDGSLSSPLATPHRALTVAAQRRPQCDAGVIVSLRSGVYELKAALEIDGPAFNGLSLRTFPADLADGLSAACLSGGRRLPNHSTDADGVYRANLAALGVREADPSERIFTLFVNGERRQRVRSELLHWNHSLSARDPCKSCPMNSYGFVYGADTFDSSWDLARAATKRWLLVSFHQWATGVHTVRDIFTENRTLFVNEPTYSKYAFDDNAAGAQRFYLENVPELPLREGEWRITPNKTLEYRPLRSEAAHDVAGASSPLEMVVPSLKWLIKVNGSSDVSFQSLTVAHSEWELTSKVRGSWRDRALSEPPSANSMGLVGGSGPLPVESRMFEAWKADRLTIDNCTIRNGGASGIYAAHSKAVSITRSIWRDFGAAAVETAVTDNIIVSDCRIGRPGQLWQQGLGVSFGHCTNATVTRCELYEHPSDGISFSGVGLVHANSLSHSLLHNFGAGRQPAETISDWGGVHTAHPNVTGVASHVHHNIFANFSSYSIGGYSLYFDYGSSGVNASQNLAYNTGSGIFFNSNKECGGWPGSWQYLSDNVFFYNHWNPQDFNIVVKWRTLAPTFNAHRNLFFVSSSANTTGNLELFHDHTGTQKHQWDNASWDDNLYFQEGCSSSNTTAPFGNTWPLFGNLSSWRAQGRDTHSLVSVDPEFVDSSQENFQLHASSSAFALGFREWNHSKVGPDCEGSAAGAVVCSRRAPDANSSLVRPNAVIELNTGDFKPTALKSDDTDRSNNNRHRRRRRHKRRRGGRHSPVGAAVRPVPPGGASINLRKDFGCKGNGIADDTQCLQNAIDAGTKNRRHVHVPGGIYLVTRSYHSSFFD